MSEPARIRVIVLGDDPLARAGLASLAATQPELEIAAEQSPGEWQPNVLAADVGLWDLGTGRDVDLTGFDLAAFPFPVVVLVGDATRARTALAAGARGVLRRDAH